MSAVNGVNGVSKPGEGGWKVGLINYACKYLTAETFGHKINVSGSALKKKQTFTLVQDPSEEVVYIKSHLGCFMSADKYGNVKCEAEEAEQSEKFAVEYDKAGSGRWAFKHVQHGYYLGGTGDGLKCFARTVSSQELWTVQLSIHPQVHLRNVNRKTYAHVCDDQLLVNQTIPWGEKSLVFLDFVEGWYALKTFDGRYLLAGGNLSEPTPEGSTLPDGAKLTLEIRSGQNKGLAFRDCNGCYLMGVGATAVVKGRNKTVTKDELFTLEDTHPQVMLVAANTDKMVSIRQGVDVTANQEGEATDQEMFLMEHDPHTDRWAFRTVHGKYWSLQPGGIQAVASSLSAKTLFSVEWQDDGSMSLVADNNSYVYNKRTGCLVAGSEAIVDKEKFWVRVLNRHCLVLRSGFGFVGKAPSGKTDVVCNRSCYDVIRLEHGDKVGTYFLKASNGQYWSVGSDGSVTADGSGQSSFQLQFRDNRHLTIRCLDNHRFLKGEQNGLFKATGSELEPAILWEY